MQNSKIHLVMQIVQEGECLETSYETDANFLEKDGKFFLFFNENNDDMITKCRFEIADNLLRMRRNGPIVIEQVHINKQRTDGYIKTPFGHVDTKLQTSRFSFKAQAVGTYHLELDYDLYTGEEKMSTYSLKMMITKKEEVIL